MNDILAIVFVCLLSDTLLRELPAHFESDFDYDAHLRCFKESGIDKTAYNQQNSHKSTHERSFGEADTNNMAQNNATAAMAVDSYAVFRELHSPEYIFADAYLLFEKIMDLGIKDMFYVGESPSPVNSNHMDETSSMSLSERLRWRR